MPLWLIYALGGGFGHLTRASALARASLPRSVRILTNSPYSGCVRKILPELDIVVLDPAIPIGDVRGEVARCLESAAPDCLIVDTFPRGLVGELAGVISSFPGCKVLVQRDLNPRYAAAFDLRAFIEKSYDLVLVPGDEPAGNLGPFPQTVITGPWLVRSPEEILPRNQARTLLGLSADRPCVIVLAAGNAEELEWYGEVVSGLLSVDCMCQVRCIAPVCPKACPPECWISFWPAMDVYAAADVVIGSAGYNTVYECVACGVPLVARPWPRKYDRQKLRAQRAATHSAVTIVESAGQAVAGAMQVLSSRRRATTRLPFANGATEATVWIGRAAAGSVDYRIV